MNIAKLRLADEVCENKDEEEIISETSEFAKNQIILANELTEILNGEAKYIEMDEADQRLEDAIKKQEGTY